MNIRSIQKPDEIKQRIIQALNDLKMRSELELQGFKCTSVGKKWLEFRVVLRGDYSFLMYFGATRKVLNHCRRMCRTGRRYVQGITINWRDDFDEIKRKIVNCILSVRQAFSSGNRVVVSHPDIDAFGHDERALAVMPKPMFLLSMTPLSLIGVRI